MPKSNKKHHQNQHYLIRGLLLEKESSKSDYKGIRARLLCDCEFCRTAIFRNEYDGHTIQKTLEQTQRMTGRHINSLAADRGYRGVKRIGDTKILIPDVPKAKDTCYQKRKKHKLFCKRAGIEPTIGHFKEHYRLSHNFYKGVKGDAVNVLLAAAAYNFKRAMRVLLCLIEIISVKADFTNFTLN